MDVATIAGPVSRSLDRRPGLRRWWRYGVTSVVATVVSETTLLVLYGSGFLTASVAAIVASLAGTVPSYAMSRHWIWPEADRRRPVRQAVAYWCISIASIAVASAATGWAAAHAPSGHVAHLTLVGKAYLVVYGALWVVKFVLYQTLLFKTDVRAAAPS
jgi:putative flippase GtrA